MHSFQVMVDRDGSLALEFFSREVRKMFRDSRGRMQTYKGKVVSFQVSPAGLVTLFVSHDACKFEDCFTDEELQPLLVSQNLALLCLISEQSKKHLDLMPGAYVAFAAAASAHHKELQGRCGKQKLRMSKSVWSDFCHAVKFPYGRSVVHKEVWVSFCCSDEVRGLAIQGVTSSYLARLLPVWSISRLLTS